MERDHSNLSGISLFLCLLEIVTVSPGNAQRITEYPREKI